MLQCPKCGKENPDDAQLCRSCSWVLTSTSITAQNPDAKTSGLAITALILASLSFFTFFITIIPAIILGIISLVKIEKSGGQLKGRGLAIAGIAVPAALVPFALMLGILIPALARVRKQAKTVMCQSNLKQWGAVFSMYASDNDGYFFEDVNWLDSLWPYYRDENLLLCPMATKSQEEGGRIPFAAWGNKDLKGSYGINYWIINTPRGQTIETRKPGYFWKTANVKGAAYIPMFLDCSSPGVWPLHSDKPPEYDGQPRGAGINGNEIRDCCINRHSGFVNGIFLDYSVRQIGLKELWKLKWHRAFDLNGGPTQNEWPEWMKNFKDYARD